MDKKKIIAALYFMEKHSDQEIAQHIVFLTDAVDNLMLELAQCRGKLIEDSDEISTETEN